MDPAGGSTPSPAAIGLHATRRDPVIRAYQDTDLWEVANLWHQAWRDACEATGLDPDATPSISEYSERLTGEGRNWSIYVAATDSGISGFVAFQRSARWLRQLFVSPACQRLGLGRALLDAAKQQMSEGFWLRTDAVNQVARCFYESAGLIVESRGNHPVHGQPIVTYTWSSSN